MNEDVKITFRTGTMRLFDRQMVNIRTGDESADMVIADLERRLNRQADEFEAVWNELEQLKAPRPEEVLPWQYGAYTKLGAVRDSMPPEHVAIVQDFIGPLNIVRGNHDYCNIYFSICS